MVLDVGQAAGILAGAGNIFGDTSLHHQIKPLLHVGCRGVAGGIRFGHSHAAVLDSGLQLILHGGGIGSQCRGQLVVQHIAGEVVDAVVGFVSICGRYADGGQHRVSAVEAIQHAHRALTVHDFIVYGDIGNAEVGKLHTLNGVLAQLVDNRVVTQAGGNVGVRVPRAVLAGLGDVILVNVQGCFLAGVDGRLGKCRGDEAQSHDSDQEHGPYAMDLFHLVFSLFIIFELSFSLFTGILVVSI